MRSTAPYQNGSSKKLLTITAAEEDPLERADIGSETIGFCSYTLENSLLCSYVFYQPHSLQPNNFI